jgi:hypothetical protein
MLITLAEKEKEVSSLKDEMSELRRENERLLQSEQELRDTLTGQPINIKWGGCNNCGKKFDTKDDATSLFVLDQCGAVSNSIDHFQCSILITLLAMVRRLY